KEMYALAIHQASSRGDHPFIAVDSGCLKLEEWNELLADAIAGPLRRGTLYLKNAEQIPVKVQKRLGVLIADEGDGPRWMISTAICISCWGGHISHCRLFGSDKKI